ncbi:DUF1294 domain-containing protein [Chloroflexus sp.]
MATFIAALPIWVIGWYLATSVVTIMLYAEDKQRARQAVRRIRENTLHLWELIGGWPGAIIAQQVFRHKRIKDRYVSIFWTIIIAHLVGLIGYLIWSLGVIGR